MHSDLCLLDPNLELRNLHHFIMSSTRKIPTRLAEPVPLLLLRILYRTITCLLEQSIYLREHHT